MCRGAYQRALQVPCTGLDQLWRAYEVFEQQGSSRALARRVLEQQRPRYQAARTALGPRSRLQEALNPAALAFPPGVHFGCLFNGLHGDKSLPSEVYKVNDVCRGCLLTCAFCGSQDATASIAGSDCAWFCSRSQC